MKTWDELLARELRSYFRWLKVLEKTAPANRPFHSHWYKRNLIEIYTRAGCTYGGSENVPFVCLANIAVKTEYQGRGLLTSLLQHIEKHGHQLQATYLVVESVANSRFASKLDTLGFSRFELVHADSSPTFYRRFDGAKSPKF